MATEYVWMAWDAFRGRPSTQVPRPPRRPSYSQTSCRWSPYRKGPVCDTPLATTQMVVPFHLCRKGFPVQKHGFRGVTHTERENGLCRSRQYSAAASPTRMHLPRLQEERKLFVFISFITIFVLSFGTLHIDESVFAFILVRKSGKFQ